MTKVTKTLVLALTAAALFAFGIAIGFMVPKTADAQQAPRLAPSGPTFYSAPLITRNRDGSISMVPSTVYRDPNTGQSQIIITPQQTYQPRVRQYFQPAPAPPRPLGLLRPLGRQ